MKTVKCSIISSISQFKPGGHSGCQWWHGLIHTRRLKCFFMNTWFISTPNITVYAILALILLAKTKLHLPKAFKNKQQNPPGYCSRTIGFVSVSLITWSISLYISLQTTFLKVCTVELVFTNHYSSIIYGSFRFQEAKLQMRRSDIPSCLQ